VITVPSTRLRDWPDPALVSHPLSPAGAAYCGIAHELLDTPQHLAALICLFLRNSDIVIN
jgi:hypothetical protein